MEPMADELANLKVAVLATDGFEEVELTRPAAALRGMGARVEVVAPKAGAIQGWQHHDKGERVPVDRTLEAADAESYDALVLPGGVMSPDALRLEPKAIAFVRSFVQAGKPIAAICHGPWTLIDAGGVEGRRLTSWPSLRADLTNAGAQWLDQAVVSDQGLVTSRRPDDLDAFCRAMIEEFAEGRQGGDAAG